MRMPPRLRDALLCPRSSLRPRIAPAGSRLGVDWPYRAFLGWILDGANLSILVHSLHDWSIQFLTTGGNVTMMQLVYIV